MKKYIILLTFCYCSLNHFPVFAGSSSISLSTATITTDSRDQFDHNEIPNINIQSQSSLVQNVSKLVNTIRGKSSSTLATITNPEGEIIIEKKLQSGSNYLTVTNENLSPGKYTVLVNEQELTTFRWGVLTLNTDQDSYRPGENIYFQAASLSETGHTLCNSNLKLTVSDQDIPIIKSETCGANNVTDTPDYFANYQLTTTGSFVAELINVDNGFKITQTINVVETPAFTIERIGATRINPFKADYTMTIKVKANQNGYSGEIKEQLPSGFTTLSPITWTTDLKSGEEKIYTYTYRAPKVSPEIFNLGPIIIDSYQESRTWSLASDATFQMQSGYYVGDGSDNREITGIGFQPDLVLIKDDTSNGDDGVIWKSSVMSGEISSKLGEGEADLATDGIQSLDADGFTLGTEADVNADNIRFTWVAYAGSDCTSSGTFCVGSYTGDGSSPRSITSVGFQPDLVTIKRAGNSNGVFRTSSMATDVTQLFDGNAQITDGTRFKTLDSTGFTVGNNAQVNTSANTYWYFAFKNTSNAFAVGSYTGNGTDNRGITGVGFQPDYIWVKNSNPVAASSTRLNSIESYGDFTGAFSDNANSADIVQSLDSDGFTVGTAASGNENGSTIFWVAFAGVPSPSTAGNYQMNVGSYTGNGTTQSVSGIGFRPDLVIIKHTDQATDQYAVFRTSLMHGDRTNYFANAVSSFAGGITSLDATGFTLGNSATVNTSGDTYYWTAFGNAYNPENGTGATDFTIGAYTGSGVDNRDILRLPFQPDMVTIKRDDASSALFRTSAMSGDKTNFFIANPEATDYIQAFNTDGFEIGLASQVSNTNSLFHFFAFKASNTFAVNSYTGTGSSQNITTPGFQPDLLWIKKATGGTGRGAILRTSAQSGDGAQPFLNSPSDTTHITGLISNGFTVGTGNLANENTYTYQYVSWAINIAPNIPTLNSPANSATNQSHTPALLTTTTDSNSDYLRYKIELCTNVGMTTGCQTFDQTSSQTGWSGQNTQTSTAYTSGTQATYTVQSSLANNTTYYWRSYAIDSSGSNTWSSTQVSPNSFTTLDLGIGESIYIEGINFSGVNFN